MALNISASQVASLFSTPTTTDGVVDPVSLDVSALASLATSRSGGSASASNANKKYAPTAPWAYTASANPANNPAALTTVAKAALNGGKLINEDAAKLDLPGASADYKKLFALYSGLNTLSGVADQINGKDLSTAQQTQIKATFKKGLAEINSYAAGLKFESLRLTEGEVASTARSTVSVGKTTATYSTPPLVTGSSSNVVDAFQGDVRFTMSVRRSGTTHDIAVDLSEMGTTPRSLVNVMAYLNDKLATAGVATRVAVDRTAGGDKTVTVGGKSVKVGTNPDSYAMKFNLDSGDTVTLTPVATEPAVYIAQASGDPDPDKKPLTEDGKVTQQLIKVQTDTTVFSAPTQKEGEKNFFDGRVWAKDVSAAAGIVHATQVGPDGSVYTLSDATGTVDGQALKGTQDAVLQKYDSAGKLIFTRTLGATNTASGLTMAVAADGTIAIAGKVSGTIGGAVNGTANSPNTTTSDSFVTTYNAAGEELWTTSRGSRADDEATNLAFGADGTVYVAGRTQSALPTQTAIGGWDTYLEGFKADSKGKPQTVFTQTVGTTGTDKPSGLVVDGTSVILANNEAGHGVLYRFDVSTSTPTQTARRDLGDLGGGSIVGLAISGGSLVVAGTTSNGALAAGTANNALSGSRDGFVAKLNTTVTAAGTDKLSFYGGTGDDQVTGMAVSGGKVFLTGQAGTDLPGQAALGTKDAFIAQVNPSTGALGWSRRYSGQAGYVTPTSIAVDATGTSVLDKLGLPKGVLGGVASKQLTAASSLRPGDSFQVKAGAFGVKTTITIADGETLDTLAAKVNHAMSGQATVTTSITDSGKALSINPANNFSTLELFSGPDGKDALVGLGIPDGVVRSTVISKAGKILPADGKSQIYGLKLDQHINLDSKQAIAHTAAELASALGVIRQAYKDLQAAATPKAVTEAATATTKAPPAYMQAQLANYQQALARLGG